LSVKFSRCSISKSSLEVGEEEEEDKEVVEVWRW
jgi:hypothetical protein